MAIQDLYTTTGNVLRLSATKDASRGPLANYTVVYANRPMRVEDSGGLQLDQMGQLVMKAMHRVYMDDPGGPIKNGDVIQEAGVSNYYRVINPQTRRAIGNLDTYLALDCVEFAP